jgi:hypothetical protein
VPPIAEAAIMLPPPFSRKLSRDVLAGAFALEPHRAEYLFEHVPTADLQASAMKHHPRTEAEQKDCDHRSKLLLRHAPQYA